MAKGHGGTRPVAEWKEELLLGAAAAPDAEVQARLARHFGRRPRYFILTASELAQGLAFVATGGAAAGTLDTETRNLLEDYLIEHLLGERHKPQAAALATPEYHLEDLYPDSWLRPA